MTNLLNTRIEVTKNARVQWMRKAKDFTGTVVATRIWPQRVLNADTGVWADIETTIIEVKLDKTGRVISLHPGTYTIA